MPEFRDKLAEVARSAIKIGRGITPAQKLIIGDLVGTHSTSEVGGGDQAFGVCNPHVQARVRELRRLLRATPGNPLVLLDYAQANAASGKVSTAERALRTALALSPNSRVGLRTLARFYVHIRECDKAHDLIRRHAKTRSDPWLMASEIALADAAGTASIFAGRARRLLKDDSISSADKTELAGAIGGLDLEAGHVKSAREMFRLALLKPNDNVMAQAITDSAMLGIVIPPVTTSRGDLAESNALVAWEAGNIVSAEAELLQWHGDEPFSSRPLGLLGSLYAVTREYERAMNLSRRGLLADKSDPGLLANLAYCLVYLGRLEEAEATLARLVALDPDKPYLAYAVATAGLMAMRCGDFELGDQLYEKARQYFEQVRRSEVVAVCRAYHARAAEDWHHPNAGGLRKEAEDAYRESPSTDAALLLGVGDAIEGGATEGRRLEQWVFNVDKNTIEKRGGVTRKGAPALIIERLGKK